MLSQIFTTFGLMILFRGIAQFLWKPDFRSIDNSLVSGAVRLGELRFGLPQIVAGAGAILATALIWWFLDRTRLGVALEATAADREAAQLMGIPVQRMFTIAWGIGAACAGIAGALLSTFYPVFPEVGANFILIAFVVVALGGFGSVTGAFLAGIIVGLVEVVGGFLIGPQLKLALVLLLYLLVVLLRPQGLLGRA
jgi:branched-chain amino acid transport system permease protein